MSLRQYFIYISIYGLILIALFLAAMLVLPSDISSLIQWDAYWFIEIAKHGYSFSPDKHSSVAFFPLLPWLIRLLPNLAYLTLITIVINVISIRWLSLLGNKNAKDVVLFLSSPLIFYFFIPYAEFLFLFGSTLMLLALQKRHIALIMLGAFVAILSRYAAIILVPALLLTFFYEFINAREKFKSSLLLYGSGILSLLSGLLIVSYIQWLDTGVWNGYQQTHIHWGHYLRIPSLPFYSAMGSAVLLLDQVALLISIVSAGTIIASLWFKYKKREFISLSSIQFISLCYLAGSGASMILFQGGSLDSLGRYIFASAFLFPLFSLVRQLKYKPIQLLYLFTGCSLFFLITGSLGSFLHFIYNEAIASIITLLYLLIHLNKEKGLSWNYLLIWGAGIVIQLVLFLMYTSGNWVE